MNVANPLCEPLPVQRFFPEVLLPGFDQLLQICSAGRQSGSLQPPALASLCKQLVVYFKIVIRDLLGPFVSGVSNRHRVQKRQEILSLTAN